MFPNFVKISVVLILTILLMASASSSIQDSTELPREEKLSILLVEGASPLEIEQRYVGYGLEPKSLISRTENKYRFVFNRDVISGDDLTRELNNDSSIEQATVVWMVTNRSTDKQDSTGPVLAEAKQLQGAKK